MYDDGIIDICKTVELQSAGFAPKQQLSRLGSYFFMVRSVGYARQYAAKGQNEQIDLLVRIQEGKRISDVHIGYYGIVLDEQYRIDNVQTFIDDDGQFVTDLTLRRLDKRYDVIAE